MKSMKTVLVAALAAGGLVLAADASADRGGGHGSWSGGHSGHWSGGSHWGGGARWGGGHWVGHRSWGPSWSFYLGVPLLWPGYYYGAPYYYDSYWYPRETVIYRDVAPEPMYESAPPTTEVPRGENGPSQGPLYMNYCESAKAYFPKVTTCPEGWKFITPN